ncbi:MAG: HAMP domain-containing histidine kinase [Acidimicrobiia bacterium]|nr:HAMP domain-containing histidine kinase [Acidimicrobiia bacterium]
MKRLVIIVVALATVWVALSEAAMQPTAPERLALYGIFGAVTVVTVAVGWILRKFANRLTSITLTIQIIAVSAVLVAALGSVMASPMFLTAHDLRLMFVELGLGVALGLTLALNVAGSVTDDLAQIARTAELVAAGDTSVRTRVYRPDEIGTTARAVDEMVAQLDSAKRQRDRDEQGRRDFLAAVGHDLRTPLSSLRAGLEALQDGLVVDEAVMLHRLVGNLGTLERLVDDLSILGRVEAGGIVPVAIDLAELADETVDSLVTVAQANRVELTVLAPDRVIVVADPSAVGRLIRNLVDNAIRYAPAGSAVLVRVSVGGLGGIVEVADQGPGFDPDFELVAFDRFTTNDPSRSASGSGLGLAIARSVIDAHHGTIGIGQGPGGVVRFELPATPIESATS